MCKFKKILSIFLSLIFAITSIITVLPVSYAESSTNNNGSNDIPEDVLDIYKSPEDYYKNLNELIPGEDYVEGEMIIKYSSDNSTQSLSELTNEFGLTIKCNLDKDATVFQTSSVEDTNEDGIYVLSFDQDKSVVELILDISALEEVEYAQPNYIYTTCGEEGFIIDENEEKGVHSQQAMLNSINLGTETFTGEGVVVAVIDTGIDLSHPALDGCFWNNNGIIGYNTADPENYMPITMDDDTIYTDDHGTHVAGIIAMQQLEENSCKGIAPDVQIMDLQASVYDGVFYTDSIIKALELALTNGADIINMSLSGLSIDYAYNEVCNKVSREAVIVAAAGNDGVDRQEHYPAAFSSVIGVMAYGCAQNSLDFPQEIREHITDNESLLNANYPAGENMILAWFSTHDTTDNYYDIVAPGVNICSTKARFKSGDIVYGNFGYVFMSGTSMATPIVAGVAALYMEKNPEATPGQVREALRRNSSKNVETYDSYISRDEDEQMVKYVSNQLDVSYILSIEPKNDVDNIYECDGTEADVSFCSLIKEQFDGVFSADENITYEDIRLVSHLCITSFESIEKCIPKLSNIPNLFSVEFNGDDFNDETIESILNSNSFETLVNFIVNKTKITQLNFPSDFAPELYSISLTHNKKLSDVSDISHLSKLVEFVGADCNLSDLSFLENAISLEFLNLSNNKILDVTPLSNLTKLTSLYLTSNNITDIEPLSSLTNLYVLKLENNYITDISSVQNMSQIIYLWAQNNLISDVGNVFELKTLDWLDISENPLKENEDIHNVLKDKTLSDSALQRYFFKPYKNVVPIEYVFAYDIAFKRTDKFVQPNIFAFPYDASFKHNINLTSDNEFIVINPHSPTLSYNKNYDYDVTEPEYKSTINYEYSGFSGCFDAYLLMPTIETASIEQYTFNNDTFENYISLSTTVDTTKISVAGVSDSGATEIEYYLDSENVSYKDFDNERIIKIDISDIFDINYDITVSAGDALGYFESTKIKYTIDIEVDNFTITNVNGLVKNLFLCDERITGIASNAFGRYCSIKTLFLSESISNIQESAFNNCYVSNVYIKNICSNSQSNIFKNCHNMTAYVSHSSPLKAFSGPTIVSDYDFEGNTLTGYNGLDSYVIIPKYLNIDSIEGAFAGNESIKTIELSSSIKFIGDQSFSGCTKLTEIIGFLCLEDIGEYVFQGSAIQQIAIQFIDESNINLTGVFKGCTNLKAAYFESADNRINFDKECFYNCIFLEFLGISEDMTIFVGVRAFENCKKIKKLPFENITISGAAAFKDCETLSGNIIYNGKNLFMQTFYNCHNIKSITFMKDITLMDDVFVGATSLIQIAFVSNGTNRCIEETFNDCENVSIFVNGNSLFDLSTGDEFNSSTLNINHDFILDDEGLIKLIEYRGNDSEINIPESLNIYEISEGVFSDNQEVSSVNIPYSIQKIGEKAFYHCQNLQKIFGGENVKTIDKDAFNGCKKLKKICNFKSPTNIESRAFSNTGVEYVKLPDTVRLCNLGAFSNCEDLIEFEYTSISYAIAPACFANCINLERCIINAPCDIIMESAFSGCEKLEQIYVPISVSEIEDNAFPSQTKIFCEKDTVFIFTDINNSVYPNYEIVNGELLEYQSELGYDYEDDNGDKVIEVPNVAIKINDNIFKNNNFATKVILPKYLKYIGESAFYSAHNIHTIKMPSNMSYIGANAFNKAVSLKNISIPNGLTAIETNTFFQTGIEGCRIPDSVTEIKDGAFWHCDSLKSVYIPDSVQTISPMAFADCNIRLTLFGESNSFLSNYVTENSDINGNNPISCYTGFVLSEDELVSYIGADENVQIPFSIGLTKISDEAFKNNTNVESISIAAGINEIGDECFSGCSSLSSVVMPSDIVTYGSNIFSNTNNLKVFCNENTPAYNYCISNNLQVETDYDIANGVLNKYNGSDANVLIPNNLCITQIGSGKLLDGFYQNNYIENIVIPNGTKYISFDAFWQCENLENVSLPESLIKIDSFAFISCTQLQGINWPSSLKHIGSYAFKNCNNIVDVNLSTVKTIGNNAFDSCTNLETVIFGNITTSIGSNCFTNCPNLTFECIANTYAHSYAIENDIEIQLITKPANNYYTMPRQLNTLNTSQQHGENVVTKTSLDDYFNENYHDNMTLEDMAQIILAYESNVRQVL